MHDLPADLHEPLHLLNPYPYAQALAYLAAAVLALLCGWIVWRRLRRWLDAPAPAPAPRPPVSAEAMSGIEKLVRAIRDRYIDTRNLRQGCHDLSEALRDHFEKARRQPLSTLTAREIAAAVGDAALSSFFDLLAEMQFRRRRPTREEFRGICDLAVEVVRQG